MKTILITTDFTDASRDAADYGATLAGLFNAKVVLFHAYQVPVNIPESYIFYTMEDVWESCKSLLMKEAERIDPGRKLNIEIDGDNGVPGNVITAAAARHEADVIICGMKKNIKPLRRIFGSTPSALTRTAKIPIIIIPEDCVFQPPANIAVAFDPSPETDASTVDFINVVGKKFDSNVSVVWVMQQGADTSYEMRFRPVKFIDHLKDLKPVLKFSAGDISSALEIFVKEHDINLLAVIPHQHDWLERLFVESVTQQLIFHTEIPLLILPQKIQSGFAHPYAATANKGEYVSNDFSAD